MADALTHHAGAPTAHGRWEPLHGGQGSISLEYQTYTSPYPFDILVTRMARAGAPPASPPPAASPAAPSTPEDLREAGRSSLDTLAISPTNEKREEVEDPPTPHLKPEQLSGHVEENEAPALVHCEHTYINSFTGLLEPEPCPLHPCCAMCEITAASEESRPPRFCNFQSDSSCPRPCSGDIFDVDTRRFGSDDWKVFNFIVGAPSLLEFRL